MARVRDEAKYALQRSRILEAAARIFRKRGYDNTTMEDIAAELKVTKAAVYYYFPSKTELLLEICESAIDLARDALDDSSVKDEAADVRLRHVVSNLIRVQNEHFEAFAVFFQEASLRSEPRYRAISLKRRKFGDFIESIVLEGVEQGIFRQVDSRLITLAIVGMCQWTHRWFKSESYTIQRVVDEFVAFVDHALLA